MAKSIMQDNNYCYLTGSPLYLHKHHIFGGPNRQNSEHYGLWIYLRADWHNLSDYGVHYDKELDLMIKKQAQKRFEELYSHQEFMRIFKKNYL